MGIADASTDRNGNDFLNFVLPDSKTHGSPLSLLQPLVPFLPGIRQVLGVWLSGQTHGAAMASSWGLPAFNHPGLISEDFLT